MNKKSRKIGEIVITSVLAFIAAKTVEKMPEAKRRKAAMDSSLKRANLKAKGDIND